MQEVKAGVCRESRDTLKMKKDNNERKSDKRKTAPKLTAAQRRRLQREKGKSEQSFEDRFAAFETNSKDYRNNDNSKSLNDRFSTFENNTYEEPDDYFERNYGSISKEDAVRKASSEKGKKREGKSRSSERIHKSSELTKKQRKTRTGLRYAAVFLTIIIIAVVFSLTIMFNTTDIIVKGENIPYSDEEIIKTSGLSYNQNIFTAKRKAAVKQLVEKYPYIESAEVTFHIPSTQIITIETAIPSYQMAVSDGFAVVSAKGRVLEISDIQRANIPLLKGLKLSHSIVGEYIVFEKNTTEQILNEIISNINENNVPSIYGIDISNTASIKLNYDNRITILLGMPEDVGYKLRTAMAIINKELSAADKGDLDVSLASSDRKSSYFTPIYSNTLDVDKHSLSSSKPEVNSKPDLNTYSNSSVSIKSAEEYMNDINSKSEVQSQTENYDVDLGDIIEDENEEEVSQAEETEEEEPQQNIGEDTVESETNIKSDYGTNYDDR